MLAEFSLPTLTYGIEILLSVDYERWSERGSKPRNISRCFTGCGLRGVFFQPTYCTAPLVVRGVRLFGWRSAFSAAIQAPTRAALKPARDDIRRDIRNGTAEAVSFPIHVAADVGHPGRGTPRG